MKGGRWASGLSLDLSTWDTLRQSVVPDLDSLDNLDLGRRLARFYEELALFAAHAERYVTTQTGPDPTGEGRLRAQVILGDDLRRRAERLIPALEAFQAA